MMVRSEMVITENGDYTGTHYSDNGADYYNCSWW
jgi:hypothetical protein